MIDDLQLFFYTKKNSLQNISYVTQKLEVK